MVRGDGFFGKGENNRGSGEKREGGDCGYFDERICGELEITMSHFLNRSPKNGDENQMRMVENSHVMGITLLPISDCKAPALVRLYYVRQLLKICRV